MHTAKNLFGLLITVLAFLSFGVYMYVLIEFFQLSDEGAFVLTIFPALLIGGIWLCYIKAKDDVSTLEHKEEMTMIRLKKDFNS